jgi:hypothetical protein
MAKETGYFRWLRWFRFSWQAFRELASFISAITVLTAAGVWLVQQWRERQDWRPAEISQLQALRSTRLMPKVRSLFGIPSDRHPAPQQIAAEFFHRHNYWLEVMYDTRTANVLGWVVTTCNDDFRPRFAIGSNEIELWSATLRDVSNQGVLMPQARFWRADTIHQPNQLLEFGRLPGVFNFVGVVWGMTDVCGSAFPQPATVVNAAAPESFMYEGPLERCDDCASIAARAPINTYGEIYDGRDMAWFYKNVGLGTSHFTATDPLATG